MSFLNNKIPDCHHIFVNTFQLEVPWTNIIVRRNQVEYLSTEQKRYEAQVDTIKYIMDRQCNEEMRAIKTGMPS